MDSAISAPLPKQTQDLRGSCSLANRGGSVRDTSEPAVRLERDKKVRIATRVLGIAGATALGMAALGSTAFAQSPNSYFGNDNDQNSSDSPIQLCQTFASVGAGELPGAGPTTPGGGSGGNISQVLSPNNNQCVNAPVADHPTVLNF